MTTTTRLMKLGACMLALALWSAPLTAQEAGPDLTGAWILSFSSTQGAVDLDVDLEQEGSELSGRSGTALGFRTFFTEGRVEEGAFSFTVDVEVEGEWYPIHFDGRLEEGEMRGNVDIPDGTSASFTGVRKADGA